MNEIARRLFEGRTPWGTLDVSPASRGIWQRVRLTVYPPGITHGQRRLLHLTHAWPVGGGILCLFALVLLSGEGPVLSLATVLTAYVAGFLVTARLTRELRERCRVVTVASEYVGGEVREFGNVHLLRVAVSRLQDLDARRRSGLVDPVTYEAEWAEVYDALPNEGAPALQRH
ncbi:hypothetical protein KNO15_10415 [Leifsonia shinshuensis]|uniref:DUF6611 family protein n=1 Tax=Leifsonia shinshuensis TaxID=150026 RepID=UPI001F510A4E|nr:DUF6611 family protein [Leifsonia shinshuensis]MCI0157106.1 hypothetical protein [Leifsonia shinshuensis]